ncbi:Uncharacterised protein [Mycobacterium tuberculosis]|nr:Uncharacterised protein [Mycobacterium tuberculosis]
MNRFAVPHPVATRDWRCRQTLSNALTEPPAVLVIRIDRPMTVLVQNAPGSGSSDA